MTSKEANPDAAQGTPIFRIFGDLAEFEWEVIRERTNAGLQAAKARGRFGDRPSIQAIDPKKVALARKLYADRSMPVQEICDTLQIGRSTLSLYINDSRSMVSPSAQGSADHHVPSNQKHPPHR